MSGDGLKDTDTIRLRVVEIQQKELKESVDNLSSDVRGLVDAWKTATSLLMFVQLMAKLSTAIIVLYAVWQGMKAWLRSLGNG